ncbi:MAG: FAD binding domain-containing protein [Paracoccaceae bacterium]
MAEVVRPQNLAEAVAVAAGGGVTLAAGCTDLFPATQSRALAGPVLDLSGIRELRGISSSSEGWRIGAMTTWTEVVRAPLPPAFEALRTAARDVGSIQIQNAGTVGGNLCNASPAADGVPCLLALDARVELHSAAGSRVIGLNEFLKGPRRTDLRKGEILTAVLIPADAAKGASAFEKLGARRYLVISIVMAAARIEARMEARGGVVADAAIAVGSCSPVALRLAAQETALIGAPLSRAAERVTVALVGPALSPIDDIRSDAAYRRHAATEIVRRAVGRAALAAGQGA